MSLIERILQLQLNLLLLQAACCDQSHLTMEEAVKALRISLKMSEERATDIFESITSNGKEFDYGKQFYFDQPNEYLHSC